MKFKLSILLRRIANWLYKPDYDFGDEIVWGLAMNERLFVATKQAVFSSKKPFKKWTKAPAVSQPTNTRK